MLSSGEVLESRYVSDIQIISNLWIAVYAYSRNIFTQLCADILFKFQWQIGKVLSEVYLGPGLNSTSLTDNSKTPYNHVTIHILATTTKKGSAFKFLVPFQMLCFITKNTVRSKTNKKLLFQKKDEMCKNNFVIMTSQRQITITFRKNSQWPRAFN